MLPEIPITTICTVIEEANYLGKIFYRFMEFAGIFFNGDKWWYDSRGFIPLSEIEEQELQSKELQKIK